MKKQLISAALIGAFLFTQTGAQAFSLKGAASAVKNTTLKVASKSFDLLVYKPGLIFIGTDVVIVGYVGLGLTKLHNKLETMAGQPATMSPMLQTITPKLIVGGDSLREDEETDNFISM